LTAMLTALSSCKSKNEYNKNDLNFPLIIKQLIRHFSKSS
jgi:hypothetical protein